MKFVINNDTWEIKIKPKKEITDFYNQTFEEKAYYVLGLTIKPQQEIWITEELHIEQKIKTLIHELTHCWLWEYGHYDYEKINDESLCEVVAKSHDFIHEVTERFKEEVLKMACGGKKKGGRRK